MTTTVTITGTGFPSPSATRAGPGVFVQCNDLNLQFDAGRSTVQRLTALGVTPIDLDAVFLTHHHSDHLTDLQDIVLTRWILDREPGTDTPSLETIAPAGACVRYLERMMIPWEDDIAGRTGHMGRETGPRYEIHGFEVPPQPTLVWERADVRVLAGQVRHEPVYPAVGYRIETPDGTVAITGDTLVCDEVAELAEGVDVLVYEAVRFEPIEALPHLQFILDYHADTRLIGKQVAELGIDTLVLTHLCPEPIGEKDRREFVDEIRAGGFEGSLIVANDLDAVKL